MSSNQQITIAVVLFVLALVISGSMDGRSTLEPRSNALMQSKDQPQESNSNQNSNSSVSKAPSDNKENTNKLKEKLSWLQDKTQYAVIAGLGTEDSNSEFYNVYNKKWSEQTLRLAQFDGCNLTWKASHFEEKYKLRSTVTIPYPLTYFNSESVSVSGFYPPFTRLKEDPEAWYVLVHIVSEDPPYNIRNQKIQFVDRQETRFHTIESTSSRSTFFLAFKDQRLAQQVGDAFKETIHICNDLRIGDLKNPLPTIQLNPSPRPIASPTP